MAKYVQPTFDVYGIARFLNQVTYDTSVFLQGATHISSPTESTADNSYALVVESVGSDVEIKQRQVGDMTWENVTDWDSSLSTIRTDITNLESSVGTLDSIKLNKAGDTMTGLLTLDSTGFSLDSVTITTIDTSAEGFGVGSDTAIPTSGLVKSYVDSQISAGVTASNGLTEVGQDIQLGGTISKETTLTVDYDQFGAGLYLTGNQTDINWYINMNQSNFLELGLQPESVDVESRISFSELDGLTIAQTDINAEEVQFQFRTDGSVIFDDQRTTTKGIEYGDNYLSGYTDRSLPDWGNVKSYVDGSISSSETYAWNGLTKTDNSIGLGGQLTKDTSIIIEDLTLDIIHDASSNPYSSITFKSNYVPLNIENTLSITPIGVGMTQSIANSTIFNGVLEGGAVLRSTIDDNLCEIKINNSGDLQITDNQNQIGFVNQGDYEENFVARSLVTKQWVETQFANSETYYWNGLTTTDLSVGLGGSLDTATTITTSASNTLTLAGLQTSVSDTPLAIVQDTAGTAIKTRQLGTMAWETAANYATVSYVDGSLATRDTRLDNHDTSLGTLNNLIQTNITDISNIESSIGDLDTLTQIHDVSIGLLEAAQVSAWNGLTKTIDNSIGLGGTLDKDTEIITDGNLFQVTGDMSIIGNLTVDGSLVKLNTVDLDVSDNIITINSGETGNGVTKGYAGLIVDRGSSTNYFFGFAESTDTFRIGIQDEGGLPADTQAVATREDSPNLNSVPYWNNNENRFDTNVNFTFNSGVLTTPDLTLTGLDTQASEATALVINGSDVVGTRELGTGAFATIANYATLTYVNDELAIRDTSISALETSVTDLSTGKLDAVATAGGGSYQIYSTENDNVAYIKELVAGTGATITQDASTITIGVTGAAGYVSKYTDTFSADGSTSMIITSGTHSLGTGPFNISVYEGTELVYVGVDAAANGDVTLTWLDGALSGTCKFIISG